MVHCAPSAVIPLPFARLRATANTKYASSSKIYAAGSARATHYATEEVPANPLLAMDRAGPDAPHGQRTMEWDDLNESFECEHCPAFRHDKTPWTAENGGDGFYRVVNSRSVILAQKCVKEEAELFAAVPDLLSAAKDVIARWDHGDLAEAVRALDDVIVRAEGR